MSVDKSCDELLADLERYWDTAPDHERSYRMSRMVRAGCKEAIPYLIRGLKFRDPFYRREALNGLAELGCRECRIYFVEMHLNDEDQDVREMALVGLDKLFNGERDREILALALAAFDNPDNSTAMRLAAGAVMMYQLGVPHDERGAPAWWNGEEEDMHHPSILRAVAEARMLLAQRPGNNPHAGQAV